MELYQEILLHAIANEKIEITIPSLKMDAKEIVEGACYRALLQIKEILDHDELDDAACFEKIEQIVCLFEEIGSNGGCRHDFG